MSRRRPRGDDGQLVLLFAGFTFVAALLVVVVVDASAAFLAHRSLAGAADLTALAAAQAVDLDAYYAGEFGDELPLGDVAGAATAYAAAYLPEDVVLEEVTLVDGGTGVRVRLRRRVGFRLGLGVLPSGADVVAEATARLPLR